MKRKVLSLFLMIVLVIGLTGCGKEKEKEQKKEEEKQPVLESSNLKVDGIYIDDSFKDENLDLLYIFYTVKATNKNLSLASTSLDIIINGNNKYDATNFKEQIPRYSDYYYSDFYEDIYVGKELKMVSTYKVAKGDLTGSKDIVFSGSEVPGVDKVKMNTDDVKRIENIAKICEDLDKKVYETKYNAEQSLLADVDASTENMVRGLLNGYYFEQSVNVGKTLLTYKIDFYAPNGFTVSNSYLENSGTYEVKAGYIVLKYQNADESNIFLKYTLENGDVSISNINEQFGSFTDYDPRKKADH